MAQLSFKRYATTSSLNTAKANRSLQEGNVVFDAELKILYIVTIKSGNIELEPYYGTNTTYAFSGDGTNTIKIKPSNADEQSITINNVVQAANATNANRATKAVSSSLLAIDTTCRKSDGDANLCVPNYEEFKVYSIGAGTAVNAYTDGFIQAFK